MRESGLELFRKLIPSPAAHQRWAAPSPCGRGIRLKLSCPSAAFLLLDPVHLHFAIQVASLQPELLRRLRDVPVVFIELRQDEFLLKLRARLVKIRRRRR